MATARTLFSFPIHTRTIAGFMLVMVLGVGVMLPGCAAKNDLEPPAVLVSPYDSTQGDALWAVAPLRNESGTSVPDVLAMTDAVVAKIQETRGLSAVSTNRVLGAMNAMGLRAVTTPQQARELARALGVDAVVAGTITAYDPYDPPIVGLTLGIYHTDVPGGMLEARRVTASATEIGTGKEQHPSAVVSEHFDARNHEVLMSLRRFAMGRTEVNSALHWRGFTANSKLFAQFAAHETIARLLDAERIRLAQSATKRASAAR